MPVLRSQLDVRSETYHLNREALLQRLEALEAHQALVRGGGGARYVERHRARGRMLPRERIELLVDADSPFLELSSLAAFGTEFATGASVVTGLGVISGVECILIANDPTVRGGASNPYTWKKVLRAMTIAQENRLPVVNLVESGGGDLGSQAELFLPAGRLFHDLTRLSAMAIPTLALVFGNSTAGGAYVPGMCDYAVMVKGNAKVFLGGPPLVKMATGEESNEEELGGAEMHNRISGLGDHFALDERECLRMGREIVGHLNWRKLGPGPNRTSEAPRYDPEEILGIVSTNIKMPFDPREVIARFADGSRFEEYKPLYGTSLCTGWSHLYGYPIGILANARGVLFNEEAQKATEFIQLANQVDTPLLFLQNTTGFIVGKAYEQRGIIKDGAKMINAVTNSQVPHLTVHMASSYGAGNYAMSGRSYDPRFLFSWPSSKTAIMGPEQLAGVMSIVARQAALNAGRPFDEKADGEKRAALTEQIEKESDTFAMSGRVYDDGIVDPRDTRAVLGMALSAVHSNAIRGQRGYGVFRM